MFLQRCVAPGPARSTWPAQCSSNPLFIQSFLIRREMLARRQRLMPSERRAGDNRFTPQQDREESLSAPSKKSEQISLQRASKRNEAMNDGYQCARRKLVCHWRTVLGPYSRCSAVTPWQNRLMDRLADDCDASPVRFSHFMGALAYRKLPI